MKPPVKTLPKPVRLRIADVIGSTYCVSARDGQQIYDKIAPLVKSSTPVCLCFEGVKIVITAFLNPAVGQLYGEFEKDHIEKLVSYQGLSDQDIKRVHDITENAIKYFKTPSAYDRAWKEEIDDFGDE